MPSDVLKLSLATGLGVSVLAGIVSGICYLIAQNGNIVIGSRRNRKWHCNVCGGSLRAITDNLSNNFVLCSKCQKKICKPKCCVRDSQNLWICHHCFSEVGGWLEGIHKIIQPFSKVLYTGNSMKKNKIEEMDEDLEEIRKKEKEQVRDFIERLINNILGGNIDDISVNKTYNDSQYLPITGQSPCSAHAALKDLIQNIIKEAASLPNLQKDGLQKFNLEENKRSYEDLLSTAILNKIISNCQNHLSSSSACSESSRQSTPPRRHQLGGEFSFGGETLESKWKNTDLDTTSVSSLEEWIQNDSNLGSTKYMNRASLKIQQRIDEISTSDSEIDDDDPDCFRSDSAFGNGSDSNWLLQRKYFGGTNSPVPVPMLVPYPTTEAKVLIGDRDIEDTSDLSDAASEFEEVSNTHGNIKNHLIETKSVIGGKNVVGNFTFDNVSDDEISADSGVKEGKDFDETDHEETNRKSEKSEESSLISLNSNTEKDTEYTVSYGSIPRTILKSPSPQSTTFNNNKNEFEDKSEVQECHMDMFTDEDTSFENNSFEFPGTYSKKEKEKWKHAIEMKDNPYSKENIEKRINKTKKSLFASDYYARQASLPSGAKTTGNSPGEDIFELLNDAKIINEDPETNVPSQTVDLENTFQAIPIIIEQEQDSIESHTSPENLENNEISDASLNTSELTSDSDTSLINNYDVNQGLIYKTPKNTEKLFSLEENENEINELTSQETSPKPLTPETQENHSSKFFYSENVPGTNVPSINRDNVPFIINKRSDNTIIKRIYSDPSVRNFALNNRDQLLPVNLKNPNTPLTSPSIVRYNNLKTPNGDANKFDQKQTLSQTSSNFQRSISTPIFSSPEPSPAIVSKNITTEVFSEEIAIPVVSINYQTEEKKPSEEQEEITKLKKQHLVASRLQQFSKSLSDLKNPIPHRKLLNCDNEEITSMTLNLKSRSSSVKDLRQRFEELTEAQPPSSRAGNPVYSITGRSISKQVRDQLKTVGDEKQPSTYSVSMLKHTDEEEINPN